MTTELKESLEALTAKYAELLTGDSSPEMTEKITMWALYSHIHKTMPNLTAHWGQTHPEARTQVRTLFEEVKALNQQLQASRKQEQPPKEE